MSSLEKDHRTELIFGLQRLSRQTGAYPTCYALKGIEILGQRPFAAGGFSDIWKGDLEGEIVCLKVLKAFDSPRMDDFVKVNRPDILLNSALTFPLQGFTREAVIWRQLRHPNILPFFGVYHLGITDPHMCLVSPWMKNGNVTSFLQRNPTVDRLSLVCSSL